MVTPALQPTQIVAEPGGDAVFTAATLGWLREKGASCRAASPAYLDSRRRGNDGEREKRPALV